MLGAETTVSLTGAVSELISMATTNVLPLLTTTPYVYWFAGGLVTVIIGIVAAVKHAAH